MVRGSRARRRVVPPHDRRRQLVADSTHYYRLYGLTVASSLVLPYRQLQGRRGRPDVQLTRAPAEVFRRAGKAARDANPGSWFQSCRLPDGATYLRWSGLFEFLIAADGRRVRYHRLKGASRESFTVYLLGQVLSFVLLSFDIESLHGSIVVVDGKAIAFVGDCGDGKSTLGAAFVSRGYPMLTDDLIVAEERGRGWVVHPGVPRVKLFPWVAQRLLPKQRVSTPMHNATAKLVLPLEEGQVAGRITALKAIYVLSRPGRHATSRTAPRVERLSGVDAFREIARAAFNLVIVERPRLTNHFRFATRLAARVPVRRLTYVRHLSSLPAVCDAVLADLSHRKP